MEVGEPVEASPSDAAVAMASCRQALLRAIGGEGTSAARRGTEDSTEEAVQRGICETLKVLQESGVAAEAAQEAPAQGCEACCGTGGPMASGGRLIASLLEADVPAELVACLGSLSFEAQKDAMRLFDGIQRYALPLGMDAPLLAYFQSHPTILQSLLVGCADSGVFAHCAQMLRGCTRHPQLVAALLHSGAASRLFELARHQNFEISSEAFATLSDILLVQCAVAAPIVFADLEDFFSQFHLLLGADMDYVVKRQALRLFGKVLLNPAFCETMKAYVAEDRFLRIHMNAMRDSSRAIQLGGFHVLKIFVANPRKPHNVRSILYRNRSRLVKLLLSFSEEGKGDVNLAADLGAVVGLLETLEAPQMKKMIS